MTNQNQIKSSHNIKTNINLYRECPASIEAAVEIRFGGTALRVKAVVCTGFWEADPKRIGGWTNIVIVDFGAELGLKHSV